ncbi:pyridoxamine 5'-phosphate oxidase family protein [Christensenellaceae bacterium OttesenSCG-928-K19]|nr:pyridoxamine 5'-phosphate oxidase family protein [Christensenellaceae bacterium OttesenSCG-928-K19]
MSKRYSQDLQDVLSIIESCEYCHVGLTSGGKPYVIPMNFGYEVQGDSILFYLHSGKKGRKLDALLENPHVCVQLDCGVMPKKGDAPCSFSVHSQSVICEGRGELLAEQDKAAGLDHIMQHTTKKQPPFQYGEKQLAATAVVRITCTSYCAKWQNV